MDKKQTGGPAFPGVDPYVHHPIHGKIHRESIGEGVCDGMTLRDYFAAKAMQAMVASPTYEAGWWAQDSIAAQSYSMADTMLKEREK